MIEINIKNENLKNFELKIGQLFVSKIHNNCFLFVKIKDEKYSLVNLNGESYWKGLYTFEEAKKQVEDDMFIGRLVPVENQKIIIEGEI